MISNQQQKFHYCSFGRVYTVKLANSASLLKFRQIKKLVLRLKVCFIDSLKVFSVYFVKNTLLSSQDRIFMWEFESKRLVELKFDSTSVTESGYSTDGHYLTAI